MLHDTDATPYDSLSEGNGDSMEEAIAISAPDEWSGVEREYEYLSRRFGPRGHRWQLRMQSLFRKAGKAFDRMDITLADGTERTVFFDITAFFGR